MKKQNDKLVQNFLKEIKKHLPEWIKSNDDKLEDILLEVSSHIWDSAQEIAGSEDPDQLSIQKAIARLGTPKEIAKSYKKRGTPRYFISEELWSIYTKVNSYLIAITFLVIMIVQIILVEPSNLLQAFLNGVTISYPVIITFIIVITAIFTGLSYEGYFPEDLGSKDKEQGETKADYYKPGEFLFNGLFGILFGLFMLFLPIDMINLIRIIINFILGLLDYSQMPMYIDMSIEVRILVTVIGIVTILTGIINLMKIRTKDIGFQVTMNVGLIFTGIIDLGLTLYIVVNLHLFAEVLPLSDNTLLLLGAVAIIGTIIDILTKVSHNIKIYALLDEELTL